MLYARSLNGDIMLPVKGGRGICPGCNHVLIAKCGGKRIHHWSHRASSDCDTWFQGETDWHLEWKRLFDKEFVEVIIRKGGIYHRADVRLHNGLTIEFQHSNISSIDIKKREDFYGKMIWVLDLRGHADKFKRDTKLSNQCVIYFDSLFRIWDYSYFTKPLLLDFGTKKLFWVLNMNKHGWGSSGFFIDKLDFIDKAIHLL